MCSEYVCAVSVLCAVSVCSECVVCSASGVVPLSCVEFI